MKARITAFEKLFEVNDANTPISTTQERTPGIIPVSDDMHNLYTMIPNHQCIEQPKNDEDLPAHSLFPENVAEPAELVKQLGEQQQQQQQQQETDAVPIQGHDTESNHDQIDSTLFLLPGSLHYGGFFHTSTTSPSDQFSSIGRSASSMPDYSTTLSIPSALESFSHIETMVMGPPEMVDHSEATESSFGTCAW